MPTRNIFDGWVMHQLNEIFLHFTGKEILIRKDQSDCRQSPRLFAEDFSVLKRLKVSIFKTFQSLFGIIKVSKKAVLFYDDTRNRKSKKANADGMY